MRRHGPLEGDLYPGIEGQVFEIPDLHTGIITVERLDVPESDEIPVEADTPRERLRNLPGVEVVETLSVPTKFINSLSQIRDGRNPRQGQLDKSFEQIGQLQPAIGVVLTDQQMEDYIGLVNKVWRPDESHKLEDMTSLPGGGYLLLIAGHSRMKSAEAHEMPLLIAIREATTVDEMLVIQAHENLHSEPKQHRSARAIGELFMWKQAEAEARGEKYTQAQFVREHTYTEGAVKKAIGYTRLPPEIRDMVDDEIVPFSVAAQIGIANRQLKKLELKLLGKKEEELTKRERAKVERYLLGHIEEFFRTYDQNGSIIGTNSHIRAVVSSVRKKVHGERPDDLVLGIQDARDTEHEADIVWTKVREMMASMQARRAQAAGELALRTSAALEESGMVDAGSAMNVHSSVQSARDAALEAGQLAYDLHTNRSTSQQESLL